MFARINRSGNKLLGGALQVVHLKWECTGTPTIFNHNYPIDYIKVDANGRRYCQHNTIIIIKLKKAMEHMAAEAEVDIRKIDAFGSFSQGSSNPSPPPMSQKEASQAPQTEGRQR
jgi:hypothetical protein